MFGKLKVLDVGLDICLHLFRGAVRRRVYSTESAFEAKCANRGENYLLEMESLYSTSVTVSLVPPVLVPATYPFNGDIRLCS